MSVEHEPGNVIGIRDVYNAVIRLDGKMDLRIGEVTSRVDRVESRQDRNDGRLDMIRWLGPAGVVGLVYGIAKSMNLLP